ncbi:Rne/Rng family ribonuclease [Paenibacillus alvei]|uniref:Rne/Rng family ribonuclease n=2 Tax=Paenibacillus TaxID=44249 RepID=A0ABT4H6C6_PAEAL|nr:MULTISPECIES: Rne/Rng family ribonuclease [Paenibacillus]MCY7485334.1 Rne/Rng family ribonuclease [Paenibacillus alvei]MCY9764543.1 Rne/Rng family ribonuclease [Paenibacillus alvei]MCY9766781.1 Rne/Rng family ribonuclease [Paenibacillus alvei]
MNQMIVHCEEQVTQMALLEHGRLVEFAVERATGTTLVGSLYKGRVVNVLPGMQAAFVDIGQKKNAFLYVDDCLHPHLEKQPKQKPPITSLLRVGQELIVQVMKDPLGSKGARVTTHYSLPGRYSVFMPYADYIGVSKKIEQESERSRLKQLADQLRQDEEGMIIRTVAQGESTETLEGDIESLRKLWGDIGIRAKEAQAPTLLHRDLSMVERLVRDAFSREVDQLLIDDVRQLKKVQSFVRSFAPDLENRIHVYKDSEPLFTRYRVKDQLDKAFQRKTWLQSGGYLVWDQTEALTVIDVNTGKYTGTSDLEETVFLTNLEAAEEIARLIRLRDIGGIIIVDFIDMETEEHRVRVVERLETMMRKDRTKCLVVGWTKLGLMELTRKKVRAQVMHQLFHTCPECEGSGVVPSSLSERGTEFIR